MPDWDALLPGVELRRGVHDLALPQSGEWWLCGPFANHDGQAMARTLAPEGEFAADASYDGLHGAESAWLSEGSRQAGPQREPTPSAGHRASAALARARWVRRAAHCGFVDFNHVFRPWGRGVGRTDEGAAVARCLLQAPGETEATLQLAWDDALLLRVNGETFDLGSQLRVPRAPGAGAAAGRRERCDPEAEQHARLEPRRLGLRLPRPGGGRDSSGAAGGLRRRGPHSFYRASFCSSGRGGRESRRALRRARGRALWVDSG